jgi:hypothetical protein
MTSKAAMNEESETGVMVVVAAREKIMGLIEEWWERIDRGPSEVRRRRRGGGGVAENDRRGDRGSASFHQPQGKRKDDTKMGPLLESSE